MGLTYIILVTLLIESKFISNVSSIVKIIDQQLYMRLFIIIRIQLILYEYNVALKV